jgi:hypothetical protein
MEDKMVEEDKQEENPEVLETVVVRIEHENSGQVAGILNPDTISIRSGTEFMNNS